MLYRHNHHNIDDLPDWTVLAFAGFLVATVSLGVSLMVPGPPETTACQPMMEQTALVAPSFFAPHTNALERPQEDWLWMVPQHDEPAVASNEDDAEPRRRRHRRRG